MRKPQIHEDPANADVRTQVAEYLPKYEFGVKAQAKLAAESYILELSSRHDR
jgi:hypothetical protein